MSYYEPKPPENLPSQEKVYYCSMISGLVLVHDRVCSNSGWHILSRRQGLEPQCGNEHCVLNCVEDSLIERQSKNFSLPIFANQRPADPNCHYATRILSGEHQHSGITPKEVLYTICCFQCGRETLDEQSVSTGSNGSGNSSPVHLPLQVCPTCGSGDIDRRYWIPRPAKTQKEAEKAFDRFLDQEINSPEEKSNGLESLIRKFCMNLQETAGDKDHSAYINTFQSAWKNSSPEQCRRIKEILQSLVEQENSDAGSHWLLHIIEEYETGAKD